VSDVSSEEGSDSKAASVLQVPLKDAQGEDQGHLTLDPGRIDRRIRRVLLKEAAVMYAANKRVGTHKVKTRAEVAGTTKKPWKQKGTGRARAGTKKSPLWRGGGVVFGPHPRDYSYQINRKQKRLALRSALLAKFLDGQVTVVDGRGAEDEARGRRPARPRHRGLVFDRHGRP